MQAEKKLAPQYDLFKAIVALLLLLAIIWLWWGGGPVSAPAVAVDPSGNVTFSGSSAPGSSATLEIATPGGAIERLTVQADDAGNWIASKRLPPGNYQAALKAGSKTSPPVGFTVPESAALQEITIASTNDPAILTGSASPGKQLVLYLDGVEVARITTGPDGRWQFDASRFPGVHTVQLAYAESPRITSPSLTVNIPSTNSQPPAIDQVSNGENGNLIISGQAPPESTIYVWVDGELAQTVTSDASGNWTVSLDLPSGRHEIVATLGKDSPLSSQPVTVEIAEAQEDSQNSLQEANSSPGGKNGQEGGGFAYIVKEDDWLTKLARDYLGSEDRYEEIRDATNAKAAQDPSFDTIEDDNLIYPGEKIWIPSP